MKPKGIFKIRIFEIMSAGPFDDYDPMSGYVLAMFFIIVLTIKIASL